jgi:hypothetical protein
LPDPPSLEERWFEPVLRERVEELVRAPRPFLVDVAIAETPLHLRCVVRA